MTGSALTMRSPSTTMRSRSTPCVAGCCGPMLSTMSAVASPPAPTPTVSARPPAPGVGGAVLWLVSALTIRPYVRHGDEYAVRHSRRVAEPFDLSDPGFVADPYA